MFLSYYTLERSSINEKKEEIDKKYYSTRYNN